MTTRPYPRPAFDADEAAALQAIGWHGAGTACPDPSLLLAAEDGVLEDATASRVRAHVADCQTCQLLMRDLPEVLAADPTGAEEERISARIGMGRHAGRRGREWWLGAAGVALAAGLIWVLMPASRAPVPVPGMELARATPAPMPTVFAVDRPVLPPGEIELTLRGDAGARASVESQVAAALDLADSGDVPGALARLDAIVRDQPASRAAGLALGATQLRADRNADARATLERARQLKAGPGVDDELDWFLSIALVRTGDRDRARTLLSGLCDRGGARGPRACAGLAEIGRAPSSR